jgi:hypothetical protein
MHAAPVAAPSRKLIIERHSYRPPGLNGFSAAARRLRVKAAFRALGRSDDIDTQHSIRPSTEDHVLTETCGGRSDVPRGARCPSVELI